MKLWVAINVLDQIIQLYKYIDIYMLINMIIIYADTYYVFSSVHVPWFLNQLFNSFLLCKLNDSVDIQLLYTLFLD